ncbi:MAG: lysophospholipid acyltransferase family protein [Bacteroidales bacterium]|nr:lysophospholipid acyltransferase family protein [Bacteroidales bacterium]
MYLLADIIYLFVCRLGGYRRRVVRDNLSSSFPSRSRQELRRIERRYYRHLADLLVEGLFNLFATPPQIKKRYRIANRQLIDRYYERGQSVILMSAHYNNWEYMVSSLNMQLLHHGVGVGKPLNDRLVANWVTRRRTRYGTEVVDQTNVRQCFEYYHRYNVPCAYMMLSDQSPSNPYKSYWTQFLNHDTAFLYGAEHFARKYNYPVLYYSVRKVSRGRYEVTFSELCNNPGEAPQYSITQAYTERLERQIEERPEFWLWSHRRWKLTHTGRIRKDGTIQHIEP